MSFGYDESGVNTGAIQSYNVEYDTEIDARLEPRHGAADPD
jgi:hypothetical protein